MTFEEIALNSALSKRKVKAINRALFGLKPGEDALVVELSCRGFDMMNIIEEVRMRRYGTQRFLPVR